MRTRTIKKYPTLFSLLLLFLVSIIAGSCGLPKNLFLEPPLSFYASGGNMVILDHNPLNYDPFEGANQSFKGYEIYYRIYETEITATKDISLINDKITDYPNSPDIVMNYAAETLKFIRVRNKTTDIPPPLITIANPENGAQFELTLNQDSEWSISDVTVVRTIVDVTRQSFYKKSNYLFSDIDYAGSTDSPNSIYAVFFAVAYANDPETIGGIVYSFPAVINSPIPF